MNPGYSDRAVEPAAQGSLFEQTDVGAQGAAGQEGVKAQQLAMDDADVRYYAGWITPDEAVQWLQTLKTELAWEQPEIIIAGMPRRIPRLQAWCGDENAIMIYSGRRFYPQPWHPVLSDLRRRLGDLLQRDFNSVLVNLYRDGSDSVGWHADDEPELGPEPCIASVSLGATRRFTFKTRVGRSVVGAKRSQSIRLDLHNGDLLVMAGLTQEKWHHSLPKTKKYVGERVNLTFRTIIDKA